MKQLHVKLLFLLLSLTQFAFAQSDGKFTNHGPQLGATMIQGSIFVTDDKGTELVYTVVRGEPAHLLAYNVKTKKMVLDKELPKADGVWDMAQASDGYLYIPGANGSLFKHKPGSKQVEDLGIVLPGETYLWNLTAGKNGEVFGATYPGCRVFRYHPKDGFTDVGKGALVEGENYVRSLAYHKSTGLLYAGVGSHAHLMELNPLTGEKKEILPAKYQDREFVYGLEIVAGKDGNDRLLALLTAGNITLVYNLKTKKVEQEITDMDMKAVSSSANKEVFYTGKTNLYSLDPTKAVSSAKQLATNVGSANAFYWGKDQNLYFITAMANLVQYNPKTKKHSNTKLQIPPQPIPINAIMVGPDQKIWTGGYLAGGHATYDPISKRNTKYLGLDQTEGMAIYGDQIYFGIYPKGRFYAYNTKQNWDVAKNNPRKLGEIEGQSRAFAVLSLPEKQKMFFGTIPEYGKLGGALISYDVVKDELKAHENIIPNQAIASLINDKDLVIAGTTVSGGLGVKATTKEAILFGWDMAKNAKTFSIVPVPGAAAITCLIKVNGHIWGMADGNLFVFNVAEQKVISVKKLYDYPPLGSHIWRSAFLVKHPNGQIYGTDNNLLFKIDPATQNYTEIAKDAALLVVDAKGTLYFKRKTELWSYQP